MKFKDHSFPVELEASRIDGPIKNEHTDENSYDAVVASTLSLASVSLEGEKSFNCSCYYEYKWFTNSRHYWDKWSPSFCHEE